MGYIIKKVCARQVLDSRGNPTVEVDVLTNDSFGRAIVPSGASRGEYEAWELRDKQKSYHGLGVLKAIGNVNKIISKNILGVDVRDQEKIDSILIKLDNTKNKSRLGANAILGVSLASARCASSSCGVPLYQYLTDIIKPKKRFVLPIPYSNVINGGKHAGNDLKIQEFMIVPKKSKTFKESAMMVSETYHTLRNIIIKKYSRLASNVGDEGGFAPPITDPQKALDLIEEAIGLSGYNNKMKIALDSAASEFYSSNKYEYSKGKSLSAKDLEEVYLDLIKSYPIMSIEDPFEENDFNSFSSLLLKSKIDIVGDDLTVSNIERIKTAVKTKSCNTLLLKVNQIGSLSEAMMSAKYAIDSGWGVMVSHRSGESEDPFISHLAVSLGCGMIKIGAPCRGERTAKYNELIRIEEEIKDN